MKTTVPLDPATDPIARLIHAEQVRLLYAQALLGTLRQPAHRPDTGARPLGSHSTRDPAELAGPAGNHRPGPAGLGHRLPAPAR
ncbi:MAG: hypothetical protein M0C28_06560 [Candidatus Moduliflexus flocculans]|nr:hypothetical protein [Candidatus Moduliflexus flocculans]